MAQVGAPGALGQGTGKRPADALRVAGGQAGGSGRLDRLREGRMSHNGNYRSRTGWPRDELG